MPPAILATKLGKRYRIGPESTGAYRTLREDLAGLAKAPFGRLWGGKPKVSRDFWALADFDCEIQPGEVVGIVGRNGAGKSTLLKILSRITHPTTGRVEVRGRVGALLEVGAGFHPELTGRENVFLNGAILGMTRREIAARFDEIVAFAEVTPFLDVPVKRYSSGMYTRLAFAVAAHLRLETMLVDEVLAVGDAAFQQKCLGQMDRTARSGRTVLFVSHNMAAISSLCGRVIWLDQGRIVADGPPSASISAYLKSAMAPNHERNWLDPARAPGDQRVRLRRAIVRATDSGQTEITIRSPITLEFDFWNLQPDARLNLTIHVRDEQGQTVFSSAPLEEPAWHGKPFPAGLFRSSVEIPGDLLNDGPHSVKLFVVRDQGVVLHIEDDILGFDVLDDPSMRGDWHGKWPGAVRPRLKWKTELLERSDPSLSLGESQPEA